MTGAGSERARRPVPRQRNRALCCACGQLRSVAQGYRGAPPEDAPACDGAPWCTWLKCGHCRAITVHAVIADVLAKRWRRDGCDREQHDRRADHDRRRIERRLRALAAEGVTVVRTPSADDMSVDDAIVEVIEYVDVRGFVLRVCGTADPGRVLESLDVAEDLIDVPDGLGQWADNAAGVWRGLALTPRP